MLTADLVNARRRGKELVLGKLDANARARALELSEEIAACFVEHVGESRDALDAALAVIDVAPREERLKDGLCKLLEDRATWGVPAGLSPEDVRRDVFLRASRARAELGPGEPFDRAAVLAEVAQEKGVDATSIEQALYADLRGAALLQEVLPVTSAALVDLYERGQAQAVLLRAVQIRVDVQCGSPALARAFFRRLKFLGLLYVITRGETGYTIVIDGPLSLFEAVTKYGQKMALVLPVLEGCAAWKLEADVRWGKARTPLVFRASGGRGGAERADAPLSDEVAELAEKFAGLGSRWKVQQNEEILELPGVGLCIPDLVFQKGTERIYLEALGFWSRDAVFRRVDLVDRGLGQKILFAVSSRLRVSEEVLDDDATSALYVYKGTMSARSVAERLDRLAAVGRAATPA